MSPAVVHFLYFLTGWCLGAALWIPVGAWLARERRVAEEQDDLLRRLVERDRAGPQIVALDGFVCFREPGKLPIYVPTEVEE